MIVTSSVGKKQGPPDSLDGVIPGFYGHCHKLKWTSRLPAIAKGLIMCVIMTTPALAQKLSIVLDVDATDVVHRRQHVHLQIPAKPGPLTLSYPKWIAGEHAPNGPITQVANFYIRSNGASLQWRRDPMDAFSFRTVVPARVNLLDVDFDYLSPSASFGAGFGKSSDVTSNVVVLLFSQLLMYPSSLAARAISVAAHVKLPDDWLFDSPLRAQRNADNVISFEKVSLDILIDSPLIGGRFLRQFPLAVEPHRVHLTVAADAPEDLEIGENVIGFLRQVLMEARAVFGAEPYRSYVWQVALSADLQHDGTEHTESSDVRQPERLFNDPTEAINWRLFPHEYVHTWNGKYRRPIGLATRNYQQPFDDSLLWMYEGLTRYYADLVLSARSGIATIEQSRDYLAFVSAQMSMERPGRAWRPLGDTATAVPAFTDAPVAWSPVRRGSDYYNEMLLIWLEVDMKIREVSAGRKSLDDFCWRFFSGAEHKFSVRPYNLADIVSALTSIAPYSWDRFFATRIDAVSTAPPLKGLEASGWRLNFDDQPNLFVADLEQLSSVYDLSVSLGVWVDANGMVQDVLPNSPAYNAGVEAGMRINSIDGITWTPATARSAIIAAEHRVQPIMLEVVLGTATRMLPVHYQDGLRYPHLSRIPLLKDGLKVILAPRYAHPAVQTDAGATS